MGSWDVHVPGLLMVQPLDDVGLLNPLQGPPGPPGPPTASWNIDRALARHWVENQNMLVVHPKQWTLEGKAVELNYALFPLTCGPSQGHGNIHHRPPANRPAVRTHAVPGCRRDPAMITSCQIPSGKLT